STLVALVAAIPTVGRNASWAAMAVTAVADARKVKPLSAMAAAGEATIRISAPSAGPTTMAVCPMAARATLARCSSSSATRRAVEAATHGGWTTPAAVAAAAVRGGRANGRPDTHH